MKNKRFVVMLLQSVLCCVMLALPAKADNCVRNNCQQTEVKGEKMKRNNPVEFRKKLETFITKEAKLTPKEAKSFFPLFYELKEQQRAMQRKIGKASHRIEREDLTEKECEKILANMKKMEKQLLELEISYYEKWRKVLPASKILRVINADRHFGRKMFNKMVEQRKEKKGVTPSISR